jgi:hypothetical protein
VTQQQYVVTSPQFCPVSTTPVQNLNMWCPSAPTTAQALSAQAAAPTIYQVDPRFRSPYFMVGSASLERHLGRYGTMSVTYLHNRGVHTQLTENTNAPLPGSYDPNNPASGVRPAGNNQNVYEYVSRGVYNSSRFSTNVLVQRSRFEVHGSYVLRYDKSDAESSSLFPSNPYDLGADYARASGDVRHTGTVAAIVSLPYGMRSWGYLQAMSGAPFNILVGQDLNGDTQYNDRPAFATDLTRPSVVKTNWGRFDANPIAGQTIIPRDYGEGPGAVVMNLAVGKRFGLGPQLDVAGAGRGNQPAQHKYILEFWVQMENLLNHPNLAPPVAVLSSPLFGHSTGLTGGSSLSPDRTFDLQLSMHF